MGAEEDAAARRERIRALRAAKELLATPDADQQNSTDTTAEDHVDQAAPAGPPDAPAEGLKQSAGTAEEAEEDIDMPAMKFRNYLPHDEQLRGAKVAPLSLPKFEDPIASEAAEPKQMENPFGNIAPKNPNWDLKRDVQKKLDKLEKRTQKALYEIMLEQRKEREPLEAGNDAAED